ncbi:MAG: hypothetical protein KW806_01090 [Candidatus Yanofskybacteria bacterium]|nr:hypothetical protein [Candidatus Yanofskybacteria bacterium]
MKKLQQGSMILYALLMIVAMLASTMALARVYLPKIKSINEAVNSTVSIMAADAASEACLYEARKQPAGPLTRPVLANGATFKISNIATSADITNDCRPLGGTTFQFRATATFRGVTRSLEVNQ